MMRLAFPDPLVWQAGIEFGLQAVAEVIGRGTRISCCLKGEGPMLEAVAYAIKELGIQDVVKWSKDGSFKGRIDIYLLPRVQSGEQKTIRSLVDAGKTVLTSDPGIAAAEACLHIFPRRNTVALASLVQELAGNKMGVLK